MRWLYLGGRGVGFLPETIEKVEGFLLGYYGVYFVESWHGVDLQTAVDIVFFAWL
jgi:hypothetical protein